MTPAEMTQLRNKLATLLRPAGEIDTGTAEPHEIFFSNDAGDFVISIEPL